MKIFNAKALEQVHIQLMKKVGGEVTWGDFAKKVGVSLNTLTNVRKGHTPGSPETIDKIISGLNKEGIEITRDDLMIEGYKVQQRSKKRWYVGKPPGGS